MSRRAAVLALILATGCKTRLWDAIDSGTPSGNRDQAVAVDQSIARDFAQVFDQRIAIPDEGMSVPSDFAVAADLSIPPDLAGPDAFTCPGPLIHPIPIFLGCGEAAVAVVNIDNPCPSMGMAPPLKITSISLSGMDANAFQLGNVPALPATLPQGANFDIEVSVAKQQQPVQLVAQLDVTSNGAPVSIPIRAGPPALTVAPQSLDFGKEQVGISSSPKIVSLTNNGNCPLQVTGVMFGEPNAADFAISGAVAVTANPNGGVAQLQVLFTPTGAGARASKLGIVTNDPQGLQTVLLSGTGL